MNSKGYTLMEVTLFLAISSALALVAFIGLGPRLRNVRFTDAVRGVEASITRAVAEAQQGKNLAATLKCSSSGGQVEISSDGSAGSSEDCVLNGVYVVFDNADNTIKYYQIASLRERVCSENKEIDSAGRVLECFKSKPLLTELGGTDQSVSEYRLTNGLIQESEKTFVGYVSDPESSRQFIFTEDQESVPVRTVCYSLDIRRASISFSPKSLEPKVEFNADC